MKPGVDHKKTTAKLMTKIQTVLAPHLIEKLKKAAEEIAAASLTE